MADFKRLNETKHEEPGSAIGPISFAFPLSR